jgi:hypothetical protein
VHASVCAAGAARHTGGLTGETDVFRPLLKLLHLLSLAGFVGGLLASLLLADFSGSAPPGVLPALRAAIAQVGASLVIPSLLLLVVSGMLLVVARPLLVGARWVWAKALVTVLVAAIALAVVQPAATRAALLAAEGALGAPARDAMVQAIDAELRWGGVVLLLSLLAAALAIWRPRLGVAPQSEPAPEDGDHGR